MAIARDATHLGELLLAQGELEAAWAAFQRALKIDEDVLGPTHPYVALCIKSLGRVSETRQDYSSAQKAYQRALDIDQASFGPNHPVVALDLEDLGRVLQAQGNLEGV